MTIDAFDVLWRGWPVETLGDGYEWHGARIGYRPRRWDDAVEQCHDAVVSALAEGPRQNPLFRMASALASQGREPLAINPGAAGFVPARDAEGASALAPAGPARGARCSGAASSRPLKADIRVMPRRAGIACPVDIFGYPQMPPPPWCAPAGRSILEGYSVGGLEGI